MPRPVRGKASDEQRPSSERFRRLPERVRLEDTVTSRRPSPPPDPTMGRDNEQQFLLWYGFGAV